MQRKTRRPVQFEMTEMSREALQAWTRSAELRSSDFVFPSRSGDSPHLSTRQYARIVHRWVREIGLDSSCYGTHTMRRTKAALIYRRTKNLRVAQLLLGHSKLESTVRYLGIEVDDALEISEQTEASVTAFGQERTRGFLCTNKLSPPAITQDSLAYPRDARPMSRGSAQCAHPNFDFRFRTKGA